MQALEWRMTKRSNGVLKMERVRIRRRNEKAARAELPSKPASECETFELCMGKDQAEQETELQFYSISLTSFSNLKGTQLKGTQEPSIVRQVLWYVQIKKETSGLRNFVLWTRNAASFWPRRSRRENPGLNKFKKTWLSKTWELQFYSIFLTRFSNLEGTL